VTAPGRGDVVTRTTKNVAAATAAQLVGKLTTFVWTVVAARALSQEDFGTFTLALSVAMIVSSVAEWGFDPVLGRRAAQQPSQIERLHSESLAWQTFVGVPVFLTAGVLLWLSRPDLETRLTVVLVLAAVFLDLWSDTCRATAAAAQDQRPTSTALILQRTATSIFAIPAVILGGLAGLAGAFLAGYVVGLLAHLVALGTLSIRFRPRSLTRTGLRRFAEGTLALGVAGLLSMSLFRVDALLLAWLSGDAAVGAYGVAHRLFETALFATFAVTAALFPLMSQKAGEGPVVARFVEVGLTAIATLYLPYAVLTLVEGPALLGVLFGAPYDESSASTLRWLALAPLAYGLVNITSTALVALSRTGFLLAVTAVALVAKLAASLLLIPIYGAAGAAATTTGIFALEGGLLLLFLRRLDVRVHLLRPVLEPAAAAALFAAVLWLSPLPLLADLVVGGAVYLACWLLLLRLRSPEQLRVLRAAVPGGRA
jgi:O-antigen/teichoic acid export membrane protein